MSSAKRKLISAFVVIGLCAGSTLASADESQWPLAANSAEYSSIENGVPPTQAPRKNMVRTVASSLAIVLGVFFLVSTLLRKAQGTTDRSSELIETLGAVHVAPKVKLHLVRLGDRLLVLHLSPGSVQRVAEISDPDEVRRLLGHDSAPASPTAAHPNVDELLRAVEQSNSRPESRGLLA